MLPAVLPSSAGALTWIAPRALLAPDSWTVLFLCFLAGAAVYLAILYAFSTTSEDREDLRATCDRLLSRVSTSGAGD